MNVTQKEFIRFTLAGFIVMATDFGVYLLLYSLIPYSIAKGISFSAGGIVGYLLNKYWTFEQKKKSFGEIMRFGIINCLALVINILINASILKWQPGAIYLALGTATLVTSVFCFISFKWWVFKT